MLETLQYIATPENSSDEIKKFTGVRLKLILDIEKNQFMESMTRGGIFMFS